MNELFSTVFWSGITLAVFFGWRRIFLSLNHQFFTQSFGLLWQYLQLTGVRDRRAVGLALGCASIGVGTARAFEIGSTAGAFASVGMSLTAIGAGFVLPWLLHLL